MSIWSLTFLLSCQFSPRFYPLDGKTNVSNEIIQNYFSCHINFQLTTTLNYYKKTQIKFTHVRMWEHYHLTQISKICTHLRSVSSHQISMSFLYAPVGLRSAYDSLDVGCAFFFASGKERWWRPWSKQKWPLTWNWLQSILDWTIILLVICYK